jgi:hypothetical protein
MVTMPASPCPTCSGLGILVARHGHTRRWAPCPPCHGRGNSHNGNHGWDAGPLRDWGTATTEEELAQTAAAIRADAETMPLRARQTGMGRLQRLERARDATLAVHEPTQPVLRHLATAGPTT